MLSLEEWSIPKVMPVVKPDVFSIDALIMWLEQQPAEKKYDYGCCGQCLLALYFVSSGFIDPSVGGYLFDSGPSDNRLTNGLPRGFNNIAVTEPYTFGAALDRARRQRGK